MSATTLRVGSEPALAEFAYFDPPTNVHNNENADWALVDFLLESHIEEELTSPASGQQGAPSSLQPQATVQYNEMSKLAVHEESIVITPFDVDYSSLRPFIQKPADLNSAAYGTAQGRTDLLSAFQLHHGTTAMTPGHNAAFLSVQSPGAVIPRGMAATMSPTVTVLTPTSSMIRMGQSKEKTCSHPDCGKLARSRGLCMRHGGGRRCEVEGCQKGSQSGGRCIAHGGGKRCKASGCLNAQQSDGLCIAHGGGKRCIVDGCNKSSQRRGFCHVHGGGQKCTIGGCSKGAQRNGLCVEHGGRRYCRHEGCQKTARGGGYCISHGGDTRCKEPECNKIAKEGGVCTLHLCKTTKKKSSS